MPTTRHTGTDPRADRSPGGPAIAFFAPALGAGLYYQKWQIWGGIARVCRARGVNLLYVAGGQTGTPPGDALYRLISDRLVDGIISWTGVVTPWLGADQARAFFARYAPLPVVNVGWHLPGALSLAFDQAQGMADLLRHLIEVHGFRRIAYLVRDTGHLGFEYQYTGYEETLRRLGLFDPALVGEQPGGSPLVILDQRGLRPAVDYQAAVCTNDILAMTVIEALRARGLRVPQDIAVTGFHDGLEARIAVPPLTTARMPWRAAGQQAAERLLDLLAGRGFLATRPVPVEGRPFDTAVQPVRARASAEVMPDTPIMIPLELVVRQSCGCPDARTTRAAASSTPDRTQGPIRSLRSTTKPAEASKPERDPGHLATVQAMAAAAGAHAEGLAPGWTDALLDAFLADLAAETAGAPAVFLSELDALLRRAGTAGANLNAWHDALSAMRRGLLPWLDDVGPVGNRPYIPARSRRAEDLWQQARVIVGQAAARGEAHQVWRLVGQAEALHQIEAALHVVTNRSDLLAALAELLPRLGVRRCFLALYDDPAQPEGEARLIFALEEGVPRPLPATGLPFESTELLPPGFWPAPEPLSLAIEALHFGEEQLGFVLFEVDPREGSELGTIYEALRSQISSALMSVRLYEEVERARKEAETANELKSRFLSVVSHELRTPLNLIVGLCEMASWEQARRGPADHPALLTAVQGYQEQIYASAQHLDRLIRDVLDLASSQVGQLKLTCEALDPAALLREVAVMGRQMAQEKRLAWQADIPAHLPPVWGDRTRLRQVLLNLISNAVKFTAHGEVRLAAEAGAGTLTLSLSDTGLGIPAAEQAAIFDEFRQSERTAARGYGGIGIGLAITRRLVELHGGAIRVHSDGREGRGSTFTITLPALPPKAAAATGPAGDSSQTVLVLAGPAQRPDRLVDYLTARGFRVAAASLEAAGDDPAGGLSRLLAARPAAVVLDCAAECDQGWAILRTLKEHPATQEIPVLFCAVLDADQGASGGVLALDLLAKPASAQEIARTLARHGLSQPPADGLSRRPATIVVADDEPGILTLHARLVQAQLPGCRVLTAENGRLALDLIRRELPDLVLLDLMMPELDGFGVLEALRAGETTRDIPVIVLTSQSLTEHDMARLNRGVAAVLGKGLFTAEETLAQVAAALARERRPGSEAQRLVRRGMAFIHAHYAEEIGRRDIARYLGVNESHLTHCFDRELGIPPMVYLNRTRIRQAKGLLEAATMTITEVAMATGFGSPSYFARVFQREVGVSPRAYQRGDRVAQGSTRSAPS
jgi:signal transduction histidine kinase/DNA-binding LacI/PurR family transcriptional regulator/DNA-binding response OmpR family regulator